MHASNSLGTQIVTNIPTICLLMMQWNLSCLCPVRFKDFPITAFHFARIVGFSKPRTVENFRGTVSWNLDRSNEHITSIYTPKCFELSVWFVSMKNGHIWREQDDLRGWLGLSVMRSRNIMQSHSVKEHSVRFVSFGESSLVWIIFVIMIDAVYELTPETGNLP